MTPAAQARAALAVALLMGAAGCAHIPRPAEWVKVTPITPVAGEARAADAQYTGAVAAISRRDYAAALDLLQAARARDPRDVRVLNAFGVVYDKLGRFDLSARYYAEGRALAPDSAILASNLAYSAALEQRAEVQAADQPAPAVIVALAPVIATPRPLIGVPGAIRLAYIQQAQLPVVLPLLTGRPLQIVNASGGAGAQQVVVRLASLGWSTPRTVGRSKMIRTRTEISYPAASLRVARALANTLPPGARLVSCAAECSAIRLTVGADSLAWRPPAGRSASIRGD
jgi:hypothetical protein